MPCKTNIEKSLRDKIAEDIAHTSVGTRDAVRKFARELDSKYSLKGAFRPHEYQLGVYRAAFVERFLPELIEKEYTRRYIIENELENKFSKEYATPEDVQTPIKPEEAEDIDVLNDSTVDPATGQLSFPDHSFQNRIELTKDGKSIDQVESQLYTEKFNEYFPDYTYLTREEKDFFIQQFLDGNMPLTCKI